MMTVACFCGTVFSTAADRMSCPSCGVLAGVTTLADAQCWAAGDRSVGDPVVTPRPLADYQAMFGLTDEDVASGRVLDCGGGASPFAAQVSLRGATAVSVDPLYRLRPAELLARARADLERTRGWVAAHPENFDWCYLGAPDAAFRVWEVALDLFAADYRPDGERYVDAALPDLPFPDGHFTLAVASFVLFAYPELFSFEQHLAAIRELVRVTSGDVRVHPLVDTAGRVYPHLAKLRERLGQAGVRTELAPAHGTYQIDAAEMLVCRRAMA